jgi:hypothetical protein
MKKRIKKPLKLNRETLTSLDGNDLVEPAGMAATQLHNQCITLVATHCSCVVINTRCVNT